MSEYFNFNVIGEFSYHFLNIEHALHTKALHANQVYVNS